MPAPDTKPPESSAKLLAEMMQREILGHGNDAAVLARLEALTEEVRALREELTPSPSGLITGRHAIIEFDRLCTRLEQPHWNNRSQLS
ncbi:MULTISPECIES: hypothetical protein [Giesbergeria]|uniref:Uncharacterized protein n=1 Tax=Giesbergeria sinuosa TaxID=80883 RepID=A0ABV9QBX8_9BURK